MISKTYPLVYLEQSEGFSHKINQKINEINIFIAHINSLASDESIDENTLAKNLQVLQYNMLYAQQDVSKKHHKHHKHHKQEYDAFIILIDAWLVKYRNLLLSSQMIAIPDIEPTRKSVSKLFLKKASLSNISRVDDTTENTEVYQASMSLIDAYKELPGVDLNVIKAVALIRAQQQARTRSNGRKDSASGDTHKLMHACEDQLQAMVDQNPNQNLKLKYKLLDFLLIHFSSFKKLDQTVSQFQTLFNRMQKLQEMLLHKNSEFTHQIAQSYLCQLVLIDNEVQQLYQRDDVNSNTDFVKQLARVKSGCDNCIEMITTKGFTEELKYAQDNILAISFFADMPLAVMTQLLEGADSIDRPRLWAEFESCDYLRCYPNVRVRNLGANNNPIFQITFGTGENEKSYVIRCAEIKNNDILYQKFKAAAIDKYITPSIYASFVPISEQKRQLFEPVIEDAEYYIDLMPFAVHGNLNHYLKYQSKAINPYLFEQHIYIYINQILQLNEQISVKQTEIADIETKINATKEIFKNVQDKIESLESTAEELKLLDAERAKDKNKCTNLNEFEAYLKRQEKLENIEKELVGLKENKIELITQERRLDKALYQLIINKDSCHDRLGKYAQEIKFYYTERISKVEKDAYGLDAHSESITKAGFIYLHSQQATLFKSHKTMQEANHRIIQVNQKFCELTEMFAFIAQAGWLYPDIKPDNILAHPCQISDKKSFKELYQNHDGKWVIDSKAVATTPGYLPPELAIANDVTRQNHEICPLELEIIPDKAMSYMLALTIYQTLLGIDNSTMDDLVRQGLSFDYPIFATDYGMVYKKCLKAMLAQDPEFRLGLCQANQMLVAVQTQINLSHAATGSSTRAMLEVIDSPEVKKKKKKEHVRNRSIETFTSFLQPTLDNKKSIIPVVLRKKKKKAKFNDVKYGTKPSFNQ